MALPQSTNVTFEAFKSITDSKGQFTTWTDIINKAREVLPINNEILGAPFKSMEEVTGDNIVFSNVTTKFVEYFRDDLSDNNKLELDKMVMFLYNDFMTSYDYNWIDQKSTYEWSSIIADQISQMFLTKQDISNALAVDEIQKIALALGNFTIIPNADKLMKKADGTIDYSVAKTIGLFQQRIINQYRTKRTKYAKGIDPNEFSWVNSYDFSLNLLASLTAGYSASNDAYRDIQAKNTQQDFLGKKYTESIYLGNDLPMGEFTTTINNAGTVGGFPASGSYTANTGIHTGNLVKPFELKHIFSLFWLPRSLAYYGHNFQVSDRPSTNSRSKSVITFSWRSQVAIIPIFADFNHIFITEVPRFSSYVKRDGSVEPAYDLSKWSSTEASNQPSAGAQGYKEFVLKIRKEQPMLYNTLIAADDNSGQNALTSAGIKDQATLTKYISDHTYNLTGTGTTPIALLEEASAGKTKAKLFSKSK